MRNLPVDPLSGDRLSLNEAVAVRSNSGWVEVAVSAGSIREPLVSPSWALSRKATGLSGERRRMCLNASEQATDGRYGAFRLSLPPDADADGLGIARVHPVVDERVVVHLRSGSEHGLEVPPDVPKEVEKGDVLVRLGELGTVGLDVNFHTAIIAGEECSPWQTDRMAQPPAPSGP